MATLRGDEERTVEFRHIEIRQGLGFGALGLRFMVYG